MAVAGGEAIIQPPLMDLRRQLQQSWSDRDRLPVVVVPGELEFYLDQRESHKQVLSLFNLNDFALRFQLQSNAPRRYAVMEPQGLIRPHCFIDLVVRHCDVSEANVGRQDQLRVVVREEGGPLRGHRDVPVTLTATRKVTATPTTDDAEEASAASQDADGRRRGSATGGGSGYPVVLVVALACLVALLLPLDEASSKEPALLRLSHQQKLVAAYVLGLVTMLLIRQ